MPKLWKNAKRREDKLKILFNAVRVKNAILTLNDNFYSLVHYDTEILKINSETNEIVKALKCSASSDKAIRQTAEYLGINYYDDIKPKMIKFDDYHKYQQSELKANYTKTKVKNNDLKPVGKKEILTMGDKQFSADKYVMNYSDINQCPHLIFDPSHYNVGAKCDCYNKEAKIMRKWGYKWNDKKGIWI